MPRFHNTDGTWLALGSVLALGAAHTLISPTGRPRTTPREARERTAALVRRGPVSAYGSRADLPTVYEPDEQRRELAATRRQYELAMPDADLARRIIRGGDVLGNLTLQQAAIYDPRRIDALISQRMGRAFAEVMGGPAGPEAEELYLAGVGFARQNYGGDLPVRAIVSLIEENLDRALFSTWPLLPGHAKAHVRANLDAFDDAIDDSIAIVLEAARASRGTEDNPEWLALAEHLEGHKAQMRRALAEGLPGPAPGRRRRIGGRPRALPGPRGRRW